MAFRSWTTISAEDYRLAFDRYGGSFATHPRVVALIAALAERPVRYVGLTRGTNIIAAAPLWGEHVVATRLALETHGASHFIDIGDAEVALPVAEGVRVELPFIAPTLSCLHVENIVNLEQDACPYPGRETISSMALAKGLQTGDSRQTAKSRKRRRLQIQRFEERGGTFRSLADFSADELAEIYCDLYRKRWGESSFLLGESHLPTVFRELKDMLFGDMLFFEGRPAAIELVYAHETPRRLFANGVQAGYDPALLDLSVGSILLYHNLERLERRAIAGGRTLRYCLGWNDAPYKSQWAIETPAYRLRMTADVREIGLRPAARRLASSVSSGLRLQALRAAQALKMIPHATAPRIDRPHSGSTAPAATQDVDTPDSSRASGAGIIGAGIIGKGDRAPQADEAWSIEGAPHD